MGVFRRLRRFYESNIESRHGGRFYDFGTSFDRSLAKALDAFLAEFGFRLWPAMTSAAAAHSQDAQSPGDAAR